MLHIVTRENVLFLQIFITLRLHLCFSKRHELNERDFQLPRRAQCRLPKIEGVTVIYYNVDEIHNGISSNRKIRFLYFEYNVAKERVYRHGGAYYVVSPFAMTWDDENYYMVAFDSAAGIIKHYRVDKMEKITVLDEERDGQEAYEALDMAVYSRKLFGMFSAAYASLPSRGRSAAIMSTILSTRKCLIFPAAES